MHATRATLIRTHRLTETSLIVHWLTEEHGLVRTAAKGARRPGSPFAGRLDLFFSGEIQFSRSRRGDLHPLREVSIRNWREGLRTSYTSLLLAGYWCRLLEMALEPEHADPGLHDLLMRALDHVDAAGPSLRALQHFEKELARHLGVGHDARSPENSLRELLGGLPETRGELFARLGDPEDFSSSGGKSVL